MAPDRQRRGRESGRSLPLTTLSVPVPRVVEPSLKVTVPVGVPAPELTVAVKVTAWPKTEGLGARRPARSS